MYQVVFPALEEPNRFLTFPVWGETESKQIWVESWLLYLSAVQLGQVVDVSGPEFPQF